MRIENFYYYDLHSEEVITSNFIEDINLGIYCNRLQSLTIDRIKKDIIDNITVGENIVFDFRNIEAIQPNINSYFANLKKDGYNLAFINVTQEIILDLGFNSLNNRFNVQKKISFFDETTKRNQEKEGYKVFYFYEIENNFYLETVNVDQSFKEVFLSKIKHFTEKHNEKHTSSFIYLTSYINIKRFISHEKSFAVYSIYKLALKILRKSREEGNIPTYTPNSINNKKAPILVCQSLNSSYIVSVLSNLLKLDVLVLDKIGPINKLYSSINKNIIDDRNYIVVSDMVCLGTEVKIVKNIIEFLGGKYLGNVSLIKTETLRKDDIKKEEATIAIFSIDNSNNEFLEYYISTNLKPKADE